MRKLLLIAGIAALAIPSIAAAQPGCEEQKHDSRVAGTLLGAGVGALIGGSVAGHGSKGVGAVAGAVGGGLIGNAAAGSSVHCDGYYDANGVWHTASGYYDSHGRWVATGPTGYYDSHGRWVTTAPYAGAYGADVAYVGGSIADRENSLENRIRVGDTHGSLSRYEASSAYRELGAIRRQHRYLMNAHGDLTWDDRADLNARLDNLSDTLNSEWNR
jgi:uncharacterized protein YcfJ